MASGGEKAGGTEEAKSKGGGRSKTLVLALVALILAVAGVSGAWVAGLLPFGAENDAAHAEGAAEPPADAHAVQPGAVRPLDPFLANLADESGSRYLKTTIQVEFFAPEPPPAFDARMPQIRDAVLTLLTSKSFSDIRTPAGKEELRDDVIDRLNHVLRAASVKSVYFTEFIVQ
jgi:flagellar FliL protein